MRKIITYFSLFFGIIVCNSQNKDETISYINSILNLKSNNTMYYSINEVDQNYYNLDAKLYTDSNSHTIYFKFNPKDAVYINTSVDSQKQTSIIISFKKNSIKLLYEKNGETIEELSQIKIAPLSNLTKVETDKLIKAFKHFTKLCGGGIKDEPFD